MSANKPAKAKRRNAPRDRVPELVRGKPRKLLLSCVIEALDLTRTQAMYNVEAGLTSCRALGQGMVDVKVRFGVGAGFITIQNPKPQPNQVFDSVFSSSVFASKGAASDVNFETLGGIGK